MRFNAQTLCDIGYAFGWNDYNKLVFAHPQRPGLSLRFKLIMEKTEKDRERDQNIAKMMIQLDIVSKNIVGACF